MYKSIVNYVLALLIYLIAYLLSIVRYFFIVATKNWIIKFLSFESF